MSSLQVNRAHTPWSGVLRGLSKPAAIRHETFYAPLIEGAARLDLDEGTVYLAVEHADRTGLTGRDYEAYLCLLLLGMSAIRSGSTYLPIFGAGDAEKWALIRLENLVSALHEKEDEKEAAKWNPADLLESIRKVALGTAGGYVGGPGDYKPLIRTDSGIYHQRMHHLETELVRFLQARIGGEQAAFGALEALGEAFRAVTVNEPARTDAGEPLALSPEQAYAVLAAARYPFSVITGGPGTGKTTLVVTLLRLLVRLGIADSEILLCAPTGKAAYRLGASVNTTIGQVGGKETDRFEHLPEPRTIHRLLGFNPRTGRCKYNEAAPLPAKAVIVDEASMIDLHLMERLVRAVPQEAKFILIGDANQLPSVDTGAILRDLDSPETPPYVRELLEFLDTKPEAADQTDAPGGIVRVHLRRPYRTAGASGLHDLAEHIRDGKPDEALKRLTPRDAAKALGFTGAERYDVPADQDGRVLLARAWLPQLLRRWHATHFSTDEYLKAARRTYTLTGDGFTDDDTRRIMDLAGILERCRILSATRVGDTGVQSVNETLHRYHAEALGRSNKRPFLQGEPILMLRNDYERGIFNGDQGLSIEAVDETGAKRMFAVFPRGEKLVVIPLEILDGKVEHAFAMTIHKSQGSEYDAVAVLLPTEPNALLTRQLLYTGVTRAKKTLSVWGREEIFRYAVETPDLRFTGLSVENAQWPMPNAQT